MKKSRERIKREQRHGDIAEVCRRVGVTRTVYDTAMKKESQAGLTAKEYELVQVFIELLDSRQRL